MMSNLRLLFPLLLLMFIVMPSTGIGGIHIEEYVISDIDTGRIKPGIDFLNSMPDSLNKMWRRIRSEPLCDINEINGMSERLRLDTNTFSDKDDCRFTLSVDNRTVDSCIRRISRWEVNGSDFILGYGNKVVHNFKVISWNTEKEHEYPCAVNGHLLTIRKIRLKGQYCADGVEYAVLQDDDTVFHFEAIECVDHPIKSFFAHEHSWYLELGGELYKNGRRVKTDSDRSVIFNAGVFLNELFYIALHKDGYRVHYGEVIKDNVYDDIVHYRCCDPSVMNIVTRHRHIAFFGLKKGKWHLVVISAPEKKRPL